MADLAMPDEDYNWPWYPTSMAMYNAQDNDGSSSALQKYLQE